MTRLGRARLDVSRLGARSVDAMVVLEEDGTVLWANDEAVRRFAREDGVLVGANALELLHPDEVRAAARLMGVFTNRLRGPVDARTGELRVRLRDGGYEWCEVRFDVDGSVADDPVSVLTLRSTALNVRLDEVVRALIRGETLEEVLDAALGAVEVDNSRGKSLEGVAGRRLYGVSWESDGRRRCRARTLPSELVWSDRGSDPWQRAVTTAAPAAASAQELHPSIRAAADALGVVTCVAFPIVDRGADKPACLVLWADEDQSHVPDLPRGRTSRAAMMMELAFAHLHDRSLLVDAATRDVLTNLANRRATFATLEARLAAPERARSGVAVVYIDLDGFKPVNDQYGHHAGDAVLVETAERLRAEAGPDALVGRIGGDEFVIVVQIDPADSEAWVERVRTKFDAPMDALGANVCVGASVGVACAEPGEDADSLLRRADRAMYGAKSIRSTSRTRSS